MALKEVPIGLQTLPFKKFEDSHQSSAQQRKKQVLTLPKKLSPQQLAAAHQETSRGCLREGVNGKKRFLSGIARMMGGGRGGGNLPMPDFFGPLFRSAFLVNKKSLFPQKCQCIELLTVF